MRARALLAGCLAALALTPGPRALDPTAARGTRDALRTWTRSLRQPDLHVRHAALRALAAHDDPEVVEELLEHLPDAAVALRPLTRRLLASARHPESLALLREQGLAGDEPLVREQVALAVAEGLPPGDGWGAALLPLLDDESDAVRAAALTALGRLRHAPALPRVVEAAHTGAARVRRRAPAALVRLVGTRSVGSVARLLDDADWRVRAAAARALADVRTRAAVEALVARLPRERGRVREELLASLALLTGRAYGLDLDAWARWLAHAEHDVATPGATAQAAAAPTSVVAGAARFYGVPTLSRRFVCVTDVSGSMSTLTPPPTDRPAPPRPLSRLDLTRLELDELLASLEPDVRFQLVTFSSDVRTWGRALVPAEPRQLALARREIAGWHAGGGTNLFAALEHVLDLAAAELAGERDAADRAPDTVYLLSDGEPSVGALLTPELLLDYVDERNRDLDLRFHCVSLVQGSALLDELARRSGGVSVTPLH